MEPPQTSTPNTIFSKPLFKIFFSLPFNSAMADGRISSSSKSNSLIHHPTNPKGGWNAAIFIIFVEFAERFAYQGLASNLIQYLTNVLNEPITQAAKDVNTWVGASSLFPLLGGFIADSYLGRFNTILFSSLIYLLDNVGWGVGLGVLSGVLGLALALFLLGIKRYRKEGPSGSPFTRLAQVFVAASRKWRVHSTHGLNNYCYEEEEHHEPHHLHAQSKIHTLLHTLQYRFLDKAAMIDEVDAKSKTRDPWRLCSVTQVEEVKLVLRLIPIWISCLMFTVVQSQVHTFFIKQGATMVRSIGPHFQIPPASLQGLVGVTILFAVPFYDRVFVPLARKFTGKASGITVLQRIGVGLFLSVLNMVVSAIVEAKRVGVAKEHGLIDDPKAVLPITIWWLLPQYMITGMSDAFTIVGLQELFYDQMPHSLRSLGAAAYISIVGVGSFLGNIVIVVVETITSRAGEKWLGDNLNKAHLDYFYWVLAVLSAVNLGLYVWISMLYVYKQVDEGHHHHTADHQGSDHKYRAGV
ncbi:hypothetical protein ACSQ67_024250 [Phaseolus vulgaris]